ncbi:fic family toxin-antitoxin system, toxin component [Peterkaempfera bronchialis]|uniref:Fic family toxin-antitoxin system, toxin component n=1 Tax=Peterkaempfera bronchialis TaxID=2126346 RepID=A0A345T1K1_9ACTN|nr:fic family toxin-antitoxin system, toxin component [Peterkaempfera bronchialis]
MNVRVDLAWLLMMAEQYTPGDPQVTDYGSLLAAVARHQAEVFDIPVYPEPQDRAAALLHQLMRAPALERSNELFATAAAYAYLVAGGATVATTTREVRSLARAVREGRIGVVGIAERLAAWTVADPESESDDDEDADEDEDDDEEGGPDGDGEG